MNTDQNIVYCARKYALSSSTLHNIASIDKNIIKNRQSSISSLTLLVKKSSKLNKNLVVNLSSSIDTSNLCNSISNMQLRSQTSQKRKKKDENDNSPSLRQKNGAKLRNHSLECDKQLKPASSKKQKTSEHFKEPKEAGLSSVLASNISRSSTQPMKLRSQTRQNNKSKDENNILNREQKTRIVTNIRKTRSVESATPLLQRTLKNPKIYNKCKESTESVNCNTNNENNITRELTQKIVTKSQIRGIGSATQQSPHITKNEKRLSQDNLQFKYSKVIENVLSDTRLNLKDRFYIKSSPRCGDNFQNCQTLHSQSIQICDYYTKSSTKMLLAETRVLNFLKALDGIIFRGVFPGVELIIELIGTILTYDGIDKTATNECIIAGSLNTFHRIMFKFPPCAANIKILYQNLLTESCYKSDIISLPNFEFQNGIFWKLIEMLENLIENDVEHDDELNLSQQSEDGCDFYTWEKRQIIKHYRNNIPRNDQIDRIFYLLHFLVDLMECEFANWLQRQQFHYTTGQKAIITSVIWPNDLPGTITINVKRIISLFTKFVGVGFPENKIKILSSLVTLIGNVMLCVTARNDYNIYPTRDFNLIESLSKEMFKIATDLQSTIEYSKVKLYSLIVTHLELPALKMLFGNVVIDKIENLYNHKLDLEKLYSILITDAWKMAVPTSPKKTITKHFEEDPSVSLSNRYPIYNKNVNKNKKSCENINFVEYISVIFEIFKSYLNYFKLDEIIREINNPFEEKKYKKSITLSTAKEENDNSLKINFKKVEKDLSKLLNSFNKNERLSKSTNPNCNNNNTEHVTENIKIDSASLKQYHSDIEFYNRISKCALAGNDGYFKVFKDFIKREKLADNQ